MAVQQLIYEEPVPVSSVRHGDCSVQVDGTYSFAGKVNSVPLLGVEFAVAALELPIVFAGEGDAICAAVVLGMRSQENAFLGEHAAWKGRYVPAFLRRYPFVYATTPDSDRYTLCIDEAYPGLNREGRGERLFDAAGKPTPYVEGVLRFVKSFAVQFQRSQAFCQQLQRLEVLEPMQAQARLPDGRELSLSGFRSVSRERLRRLPTDTLGALAAGDELELVHAHLLSLRNFMTLRERMVEAERFAAPE
jgi:hypothetical protein